MTPHFLILLLTLPGLLASCGNTEITDEIELAQQRWDASNIENYIADMERICFCPPPSRYTLFVDSGTITRAVDSESGEEIKQNNGYSTVDELFEWLLEAAARNPEKLELEFHNELGYPTLIDYNQSDMIADEELLIRILDLRQE